MDALLLRAEECPLHARLRQDPLSAGAWLTEERLNRLTLWLLLLGLLARCMRYFLRFPLWEDEAFLCTNLLDRGYAELMRPLQYQQVAPLLFLWLQLTCVKLLGFHELSLRLVSFVSGIGSLLLFQHLARRFLTGFPRLLAVGVFAVSYAGIRYSAEAKPYGSDLFVALVLLTLAAEMWRRPDQLRWPILLTVFAPLALGLSYPAVFVAGGVSIWWLWRLIHGTPRRWLAYGAYNVVVLASFLAFYLVCTRNQMEAENEAMGAFWQAAFPPIAAPWKLPQWLLVTHTSHLLAYPVGGQQGASTLTFIHCAAGTWLLWRRRNIGLLLLCFAPLALTFVAAALHKYPYGGHVRLNLYMAPLFCLLTGLGAAWLLTRLARGRFGTAVLAAPLVLLALVGGASIARDALWPYKSQGDLEARSFAQWFWPNAEHDGEAACLKTDLGRVFSPETYRKLSWAATYLCNQRIYSPRHARRQPLRWEAIAPDHPLRCVLFRDGAKPFDQHAYDAWLEAMQRDYALAAEDRIPLVRYNKRGAIVAVDYVHVLKFVPRTAQTASTARHTQ